MIFLISVLFFIGFVIFSYFFIRNKVQNFSNHFLGGNHLREVIQTARLDEEDRPKSLASMDRLYLEQIINDFPDLNISELKRIVETMILDCFLGISKKDSSQLEDKIKKYVDYKIMEYQFEKVSFQNFKFHNTVVSNYKKNKGVASICFGSSFEYFFEKENSSSKKIQDRAKVEFIYIIDESFVPNGEKSLGLNCPNCGSPLRSTLEKECTYCGSGVLGITKRIWVCNDISFY